MIASLFLYYKPCAESCNRRLVVLRKAVQIGIAIFVSLLLHGVAYCDSSMTLTLDPPASGSVGSAESHLQLHHETLKSAHARSRRVNYSSSAAKESVVGWVGVVSSAKVDIKRTASRRSRTLFSCQKDTYLAIVGEKGSWYGVLMIDSSTGWVEKGRVSILNYQVVSPSTPSAAWGNRITSTALKYLGVPYRWGGCSTGGLDCSGFVKTVFASNGISLPRVAREQAQVGEPVRFDALHAGDRLYFACKGGQVDHAGIYLGNGLFIHSSVTRHGVAVDSINKPLFARSLVVARRS
jgi:hypothetical protein